MLREIPVWVRWLVLLLVVLLAFMLFFGLWFGHGEGGLG
jgi:hypothetical protein